MTQNAVDSEWDDQPDDPASEALGYQLDDWERITTATRDPEQFIYLPGDEELLREEAFIVVSPSAVENLLDNR